MMRPYFIATCNITHILGKDAMRLPFKKHCNVTYILVVRGKDVTEIDIHKMFNVTYKLLVKKEM